MDDESQTTTVPEAGRLLGLTRAGAYEAVRRKEIPAIRFGRLLRVPKRWLDQVLGAIPPGEKERVNGSNSNKENHGHE